MVTGSSSGIGFETSLGLARNGFYTFASMRDVSKGNKIKELAKKENLPIDIIELDVDKEDSIKNAVKTIIEKKQRFKKIYVFEKDLKMIRNLKRFRFS